MASTPYSQTRTPHHGSHSKAIDEIIMTLNDDTQIGLPIRDQKIWSPSTSGRDIQNQCVELIKRLYFRSQPRLLNLVRDFIRDAPCLSIDARIGILHRLLSDGLKSCQFLKTTSLSLTNPAQLHSDLQPHVRTAGNVDSRQCVENDVVILSEDSNSVSPPDSPTSRLHSSSTLSKARYTSRKREHGEGGVPHSPKLPKFNSGAKFAKYHEFIDIDYILPQASSEHSFPNSTSISSSATLQSEAHTTQSPNTSSTSNFESTENATCQQAFRSGDRHIELDSPFGCLRGAHPAFLPAKEHTLKSAQRPFGGTSSNTSCLSVDLSSPRAGRSATPNQTDATEYTHHLIRSLPRAGLFLEDVGDPCIHEKHPFKIRYECARLAAAFDLPLWRFLSARTIRGYEDLWTSLVTKHDDKSELRPQRTSLRAWEAAADKFLNISLKGQLNWVEGRKSAFRLQLEPMCVEKSCRFQRAFGGDRFLYIKIPRLNQAPSAYRQGGQLRKYVLQWLMAPKFFLGRSWRVIYIEPCKSKQSKSLEADNDAFSQPEYRVVLFATHGCDIAQPIDNLDHSCSSSTIAPAITVAELLTWFMPLQTMSSQSFCKAFARLALGFSATEPTTIFRPDQVHRVPDTLADGLPECTMFADVSLHQFQADGKPRIRAVMNDGCSRISVAACQLVWQQLSRIGPLPSAFQARMNGAKGVWIRSGSTENITEENKEVWIEVNDSQAKFPAHVEDGPDGFDPNRWNFEVLDYSKKPRSSTLHIAFLPILLDRGVQMHRIHSLIVQGLDHDRNSLLQALNDPVAFRSWINSHNNSIQQRIHSRELDFGKDRPPALVERAISLLEAGFDPLICPYLGEIFLRLSTTYFIKVIQGLKINIPRSTYVLCIADPVGVLNPGEIQLTFSEGFTHETLGETFTMLQDCDVLVTRHPALRRSDMQKVKAVYRSELAYVKDVIICSTRGQTPLASKLQGGDYDGDKLLVIWEPLIVEGFRNAPAPSSPPKPEDLGVEVDRRMLGDLDNVELFLEESFKFRLKPDFLGMVTTLHQSLVYDTNQIQSPAIDAFASLHDCIIDSAKNGLSFDDQGFQNFKNKYLGVWRPRRPTHKAVFNRTFISQYLTQTDVGTLPFETNNTIDELYFKIVMPHMKQTLNLLSSKMARTQSHADQDLSLIHREEMEEARQDQEVAEELASLQNAFGAISRWWSSRFATRSKDVSPDNDVKSAGQFAVIWAKCYNDFTSLKPKNPSHPHIRSWLKRNGHAPSRWDLLKASILWDIASSKGKPQIAFWIASDLLCFIKATSNPRFRVMTGAMWAQMKPKKYKAMTVSNEGESFGSTEEGLQEQAEDYESLVESEI